MKKNKIRIVHYLDGSFDNDYFLVERKTLFGWKKVGGMIQSLVRARAVAAKAIQPVIEYFDEAPASAAVTKDEK